VSHRAEQITDQVDGERRGQQVALVALQQLQYRLGRALPRTVGEVRPGNFPGRRRGGRAKTQYPCEGEVHRWEGQVLKVVPVRSGCCIVSEQCAAQCGTAAKLPRGQGDHPHWRNEQRALSGRRALRDGCRARVVEVVQVLKER
jgi:hypothetical protein